MNLIDIRQEGSKVGIGVDGVELRGVLAIEYSASVHEVPQCVLTVIPDMAIRHMCNLEIKPSVDSIKDALKCIVLYGNLDPDFRNSMESMFEEILAGGFDDSKDLTAKVIEYIDIH